MLKKDIRKEYLQKRRALTDKEWKEDSVRMTEHFSTIKLPAIQYVLSYYPLSDHREFEIDSCITALTGKFPNSTIAWPRIESHGQTMEAYEADEKGVYAKNKYNILEPVNGKWISPDLFDIAFIPLVAFDKKGFRIGYGKGFYDRYLGRCRPGLLKIGFSFFDPVEQIKDIDVFDVPLDLCITPSCIYEF